MKIAFLDRDGVLNKEIGRHVSDINDFEILPGVVPALQLLSKKAYKLVVITNQSGIGLGLYGHVDVANFHQKLISHFADNGIELLEIFYCPHHPSTCKCLCRKPEGLMVEKALAKYKAKPQECIMFGDRERDVLAAEANGVRGVLMPSNGSLYQFVENNIE